MAVEFVNAFVGRNEAPADSDVSAVLGKAKDVWDRVLAELDQDLGLAKGEWNSYSPKAGWAYRVKQKDRNIVYLSPGAGCFQATFVLGAKAMEAARESHLPQAVAGLLETAQKYPEGWVVRLRVATARDTVPVKKLAAAKLTK